MELKGPANEEIYVGLEEATNPGHFQALPFFESTTQEKASEDYDIEGLSDYQFPNLLRHFEDKDISRSFSACTDEWNVGDLSFRVYTPFCKAPEPDVDSKDLLKAAYAPVIHAEITVDNRSCTRDRKVFFGYSGSDRSNSMHTLKEKGFVGVGQGREVAVATDDVDSYAGIAWQPEAVLAPRHQENVDFMLGSIGLLVGKVAAGEVKTFRYAIAFFREGTVTSGLPATYLYRRWFNNIESVLGYGLSRHSEAAAQSRVVDENISRVLDPVRAAMVSHSIRSYVGCTQMLDLKDHGPLWVVNEGEYRMMNTFDLTVDQLYMELSLNPWTIRNVLDFFVKRYSYEDEVRFPGDETNHPGGIAFCHDMGVGNVFSPEEHSCYEQAGLRGVFSYMSFEELVNWGLCAAVYHSHTGDSSWVKQHEEVFEKVVQSMANRDNPVVESRNGLMGLDAARCKGGKEITTYDSLDASLGQARNNLYLGVKTWATYVLLEPILRSLGKAGTADLALKQAELCAQTIAASADESGFLPAVLGEGVEARIIPAIEGLVFPFVAGREDLIARNGNYGELRDALDKHFDLLMKKGVCLFDDGGWKLSSTSRNSWLSKIYLCQFIAERILDKSQDTEADAAHWEWLMDEDNAYFAWSDQMLAGKAHGSRYYPRGVTSLLWLTDNNSPTIPQIAQKLFGQA